MKRNYLYILLTVILIISCKDQKNIKSFTLNGTVNGDTPNYIYLEYGKVRDCTIVMNNKFQFIGFVEKPIEATFIIPPISSMVNDWFYLENNIVDIEISIEKKTMKTYEINFIKVDTILGVKTELIRSDFESFKRSYKSDANWNSKLFQKLAKIIEKKPSNSYSGYLLAEQVINEDLNIDQIKYLFKKIDSNALSNTQLESIRRVVYPDLSIEVGKQLFDFDLPNLKNEIISSKNFRGKVVLIDFWASWCAPCRKVNPELLEIYKQFKDNEFTVLGVSLDVDLKKWNNAIVEDKLIWENIIDIEGFNGEIAAKYNVTSIPTNFLVSKNGKIIAKNITIDDLKIQLNKILGANN
ncbi:TlpA disulfide reductase family protein [Lutibacter sp.]|uniref:TlpA disulfide reductase family protein n=1 Tax=Lutibacter sp. TaxID=1925666 RepID=UPI0025C258D0|nr:TlpA disulfide reductase family protein [Lutibacter sp.]MCF6181069.1 AhpC/TSA family protein [Lutibacter sp.]